MKKLLYIYGIAFSFVLMSFTWMISAASNPEVIIAGKWQEREWEYERGYKKTMEHYNSGDSVEMRRMMGMFPMLHEVEKWAFMPDGELILIGEDKKHKTARWSIKGRGNVLEIKYDDGLMERYNITQLMDDRMVLNFELSTQIRGIAKLTFDKIM